MCIAACAFAQQKDSLEIIRHFLEINNVYKKLPLHFEVNVTSSTNFITEVEDTLSLQIKFYLQPQSSYIRYGEVEQFVNDSVALLITDAQQRMILYSNPQSLTTRMKTLMGSMVQDSSVEKIAKKYFAGSHTADNLESIHLKSRKVLYNTVLSNEEVEIEYDVKSKAPTQVKTIKRKLIPLEEEEYNRWISQPGMKDKLIALENNKGWFLIKEVASTFNFSQIDYDTNLKAPVCVFDRIIKTEKGTYVPVKGYESYSITTIN
jgi:hypothetical protein